MNCRNPCRGRSPFSAHTTGRIIQMRQNAPGRYRLVKRIRFPGQNRVRIEGELVNLGKTELRTPVLLHPFYRVFGTQEKPIKKNGTSEFDMDPARPPVP